MKFATIVILFYLMVFTAKLFSQDINNYKIAYNVLTDKEKDNYEIFIMNADGSGKRNITNHKDVAWTYYAFENRLFFISDRDTCYRCYYLYEMDKNGNNIKKVSDLRLEDSWMGSRNNGKEMIVTGRTDRVRGQFFIINTENGSYRQITNDTAAMFRDPAFSPDGSKIVFAYKKNKRDKSVNEELWIMNDDGSGMRRLTQYPQDDPGKNTYHYKAGPPKWNPKHNFISYHSYQNGKYSLFAVTPDGNSQWELTDYAFEEGWHDWSPDGEWLAIEIFDSEQTQFDIYLMNFENKSMKKLTDSTYKYQQCPVFVK